MQKIGEVMAKAQQASQPQGDASGQGAPTDGQPQGDPTQAQPQGDAQPKNADPVEGQYEEVKK